MCRPNRFTRSCARLSFLQDGRPRSFFMPSRFQTQRCDGRRGSLLAAYAVRAGKAEDLTAAIAARKGQPLAELPAKVLAAQLALAGTDIKQVVTTLEAIAARARSRHLAGHGRAGLPGRIAGSRAPRARSGQSRSQGHRHQREGPREFRAARTAGLALTLGGASRTTSATPREAQNASRLFWSRRKRARFAIAAIILSICASSSSRVSRPRSRQLGSSNNALAGLALRERAGLLRR